MKKGAFQKRYVLLTWITQGDIIRPRAHNMHPCNEWFPTCCFTSHQHHL